MPGKMVMVEKKKVMSLLEDEMDIPDLMCVFWDRKSASPAYLLKEDYPAFKGDIANWRDSVKRGVMKVEAFNLKTLTTCYEKDHRHKKFHTLTLQMLDDGELRQQTDPVGLMIMGFWCDGLTYYFTDKKVRDMIAKYVMSGKN
jgi:hypothetical protein